MRRSPQIDILRGVAALGVYVFHAQLFAGFPKYRLPAWRVGGPESSWPNPLSLGATGVSLFFVLSGLCLSLGPLQRVLDGRPPLAVSGYFRSRFARIYPAYFAALVISAGVQLLMDPRGDWVALAEQVVVHAVFAQDFSSRWALGLNGPLWSMVTEVQFYLAFPWLLRWMIRWQPRRFVLGALAMTVGYRLLAALAHDVVPEGGSVSLEALLAMQLPGRLAEFAFGMGLASMIVERRTPRRRIWMVCSAVALPIAFAVRLLGPAPLAEAALGCAYACVVGAVLAAPQRDGTLNAWWTGAAAELGRASYSFFLLHFPLLGLLIRFMPHSGVNPYVTLGCALVFLTPLCVAMSYLLYRSIETRFSTPRQPDTAYSKLLETRPKA